jgi:regulator of sigma E protease
MLTKKQFFSALLATDFVTIDAMSTFLFVLGIFLFASLIIIHELGHFIAARRNGVDVEEFGLFFPPSLYKRKTKGGWNFSINSIPLGGFVKLKGEYDSDTEKGSFGAASLVAKFKIMTAGVAMNLLTALVLFTILALIGMPKLIPNQFSVKGNTKTISSGVLVTDVESGSPAAHAGIKGDDEITALGQSGKPLIQLSTAQALMNFTKKYAGKKVEIEYKRSGQEHQATTTLLSNQAVAASNKTNNPKGHLGIVPNDYQVQRSTWGAPIVAVGFSAQLTGLTFQGIGHAIGGLGSLVAGAATGNKTARENGQTNATADVTGPVGIVALLKDSSVLGWQFVLTIIAYISLALAIMNILPIPVLDGGKLWFTLLARAIKRPLSARSENIINLSGLVVLLCLFVLITIVDVKRF